MLNETPSYSRDENIYKKLNYTYTKPKLIVYDVNIERLRESIY